MMVESRLRKAQNRAQVKGSHRRLWNVMEGSQRESWNVMECHGRKSKGVIEGCRMSWKDCGVGVIPPTEAYGRS